MKRSSLSRTLWANAVGALLTVAAGGAAANQAHQHPQPHQQPHNAVRPTASAAAASSDAKAFANLAALRLAAEPAPISARYRMTVSAAKSAHRTKVAALRQQDWYFSRDAHQIALLKDGIDETWRRDDRGRLSFERVFHEDQRVTDYSAGELVTLGVAADWLALATFIDARELAQLKLVSRRGKGAQERLLLSGQSSGETVTVEWLPALQLPARLVRSSPTRGVTRIELKEHADLAPAAWPKPGVRSADYLRIDAADFGDMDYDAVVRKSEALDIRLGWRTAHKHE